jgi:aspartyl-tRNA(Asn)/glutamyl-tRNA(Gln) amidotransferase subunit C
MSNIDIKKLTKMTNITVEPEVFEKFASTVNNILDWCETLNTVDTSNTEPLFSVFDISKIGLQNYREDVVTKENHQEKILKIAPDKEDVFIAVPKVIE